MATSLSQRIGVDLGSANIRIWTPELGVVVDEPSCIAIDQKTKKVLAVGKEAAVMSGRVLDRVSVEYPIQNGVVYDLAIAQALLKILLAKIKQPPILFHRVFMVSVPAAKTEASQQTVTDLFYSLGGREVFTIAQPLAASIGAGVPIADASGSFLLQMGGSLVEAAVISLGSMVSHASIACGGSYFADRVQFGLRKKRGLQVSDETARQLLQAVVSLDKQVSKEQLVAGKDVETGSPTEITIATAQLATETGKLFAKYERLITQLLTTVPAELTVDIVDKGLLLSGGFAKLDGIEQFFVQSLGVPVAVVEESELAVIKGIGITLEHLDAFTQSLGYQQE